MLALASLAVTALSAQPIAMPGPNSHLQSRPLADGRKQIVVKAAQREWTMGYTDTPTPADVPMPDNMKAWLDCVNQAAEFTEQHPEVQLGAAIARGKEIRPLLKGIMWDQSAPYNSYCPPGTPVGCVATALAQVMYYWRWPEHGFGKHSYKSNGKVLTADFGNTTYAWDLMYDAYNRNTCTRDQNDAVALLSYHCGVAVDMQYAEKGSGSFCQFIPNALINYFGYNNLVTSVDRAAYTYEAWDALLTQELEAGRPVIISGANTEVGHAYVIDGRNAEGLFHVNWGWSGYYNGYFDIGILNPDGAGIGGAVSEIGYCLDQDAVIQICPEQGVGIRYSPLHSLAVSATVIDDGKSAYLMADFLNNYGTPIEAITRIGLVDQNGKKYQLKEEQNSYGRYTDFSNQSPYWSYISAIIKARDYLDGTYSIYMEGASSLDVPNLSQAQESDFIPIRPNAQFANLTIEIKDHEILAINQRSDIAKFSCQSFNQAGRKEFAMGRPYDFEFEVRNEAQSTFVGNFTLYFDAGKDEESYQYDSPDNIKIAPGESYTLHFPVCLKREGRWTPNLYAQDQGLDCLGVVPYEGAGIAVTSRHTEESPALLTLADKAELLTARCEVDGDIEFHMVINNAEGGNFADQLGMRFFGTKSGTGSCKYVVEQMEVIPMKKSGHDVTLRGKLTGIKGNTRYYAIPSYKNPFGDYEFILMDGTQESCPIEVRVYNASAGIEAIEADPEQQLPAYDLMGRRVAAHEGFLLRQTGISVVR